MNSATMRATATLKPGQRGTKQLLAEYGESLYCVRYRYDARRGRRYKTVELIISESEWQPPFELTAIVQLRVEGYEKAWQAKVREAGGLWNPSARVWEIRYERALDIGAEGRIIKRKRG